MSLKPDVLIVDSIQTMYDEEQTTSPGSVGQVKLLTMSLMQLRKKERESLYSSLVM